MQWPFAFLAQKEQKQMLKLLGYSGVCMKQQTKLRAQNTIYFFLHIHVSTELRNKQLVFLLVGIYFLFLLKAK